MDSMKKSEPVLREIGKWSQEKLIALEKYAKAYAQIMKGRPFCRHYIDPFCGAGMHIARNTKKFVEGSPIRILEVTPPFHSYHFIDKDGRKTSMIEKLCFERFSNRKICLKTGDCNDILEQLLSKFSYEDYDRLFCFVDPYGMHMNWKIIQKMGESKIADLFINFPIMDINRNALWHDPKKIPVALKARMNQFWGNESWLEILYSRENLLKIDKKKDNPAVAKAFCEHLQQDAGFKYVSHPKSMKNDGGATLYYLIVASQKEVAGKIANDIFKNPGRTQ